MNRKIHHPLLAFFLTFGNLILFLILAAPSSMVAAAPDLAPDAPRDTSTTIVSGLPDPTVVGQTYSVNFEVRPNPTGATPYGTVEVSDGTGDTCSKTVLDGNYPNGWGSWCTMHSLTAGSKSLVATFTPDDTEQFNGSISAPEPHQVNKANTTTAVTYAPASPKACSNTTLTATVSPVSPGGGTPASGTVTFYEGALSLGTGTYAGSGEWDLVLSLLPGWHSIHAVYGGNSDYFGSTAPVNTFNVEKADSTTTVTSLAPNPSIFGNAVTIRATSSGSCGTPSGTVNFYESGSPVGSASLNGSGVADLIVYNFSVGAHVMSATYTGDSFYGGSSSGNHTHNVNKRNVSSVTVTSSLSPSVVGQSVTFTANVSSDISTKPTGQVVFKDGSASLGTRILDASGQATLNTSALTVGSHSITVEYQGDANFNTATSPALTQQVDKADTTTALTSSSSPSTYGQSVSFTATVSAVPPGGGTPDGSVTFKGGGATIGTASLVSGQATLNTSSLGVGLHFITAEYDGSASYNGSTSNYIIFQVDKANTSTALITSGSPSTYGQLVTFTATVMVQSPGSGTPSGTVLFKNSNVTIGAGILNGSGQASFSISTLSVGAHSITAEYTGASNYNSSTSTTLTLQVNKSASATALIVSTSTATVGETVIFTATVTAVAPGSGTPGGIVTFKEGSIPLASVPLDGSGIAAWSTTSLSSGAHSITAQYGGDASFSSSLSSPVGVTLQTQADVSIEKTGGPGTAYAGEQKQYQVWVTNNGPSEAQQVVTLDVLPDEVSYQIDSSSGSCAQPANLAGLRSTLNGANEVPPVVTSANGLATFVLDTTINQLTYAIQVSQIGAINSASIHTGGAGVNGPVLVTLYSGTPLFDPTHPLVGNLTLSPSETAAILANPAGYYVNVLTTALPTGEIRGQMAQTLNTPLRCELGSIPSDQTKHFDVYVTTSPQAIPGSIITNVAMVSSVTDLEDPLLWNNVSRVENLVEGKADLKVTKYGKPDDEVRAGEMLTYTIIVDNLGPGLAHSVVLTDVLQSNGDFLLVSVIPDRPAVCVPDTGTFSGLLVMRCDLIDPLEVMTPTESGRWILTVVVTAEERQSINNTVQVVGEDLDPNLSNNQAFVEHDISSVADLEIIKTAMGEVQVDGQPGGTVSLEPDQVTAGRYMTYTLTVNNHGPSTAENVVVQDNLPDWIEIQDILPSQGSCNWGTPGDPLDKMTCGLGSIPPDAFATVMVMAEIPSWVSNGTTIRNDALVYNDVFDPSNADNFTTNLITVNAWADLVVNKMQQPDIVAPMMDIIYTIVVSNTGPSDAFDSEVIDILPDGIANVNWTCISSEKAFCYPRSGMGSIMGQMYLYAGGTLTYTIQGMVYSWFTITNTVSVTTPTGIPDPYLENNQSSDVNEPLNSFFPFVTREGTVSTGWWRGRMVDLFLPLFEPLFTAIQSAN